MRQISSESCAPPTQVCVSNFGVHGSVLSCQKCTAWGCVRFRCAWLRCIMLGSLGVVHCGTWAHPCVMPTTPSNIHTQPHPQQSTPVSFTRHHRCLLDTVELPAVRQAQEELGCPEGRFVWR